MGDQKTCLKCGKIINDPNNKTRICPDCKEEISKTGAAIVDGATAAAENATKTIKKYGPKIMNYTKEYGPSIVKKATKSATKKVEKAVEKIKNK